MERLLTLFLLCAALDDVFIIDQTRVMHASAYFDNPPPYSYVHGICYPRFERPMCTRAFINVRRLIFVVVSTSGRDVDSGSS